MHAVPAFGVHRMHYFNCKANGDNTNTKESHTEVLNVSTVGRRTELVIAVVTLSLSDEKNRQARVGNLGIILVRGHSCTEHV